MRVSTLTDKIYGAVISLMLFVIMSATILMANKANERAQKNAVDIGSIQSTQASIQKDVTDIKSSVNMLVGAIINRKQKI